MEGIRRALVLVLVRIAGTVIEQAPAVGLQMFLFEYYINSNCFLMLTVIIELILILQNERNNTILRPNVKHPYKTLKISHKMKW